VATRLDNVWVAPKRSKLGLYIFNVATSGATRLCPGQEASSAPPCSNLMSFGSKYIEGTLCQCWDFSAAPALIRLPGFVLTFLTCYHSLSVCSIGKLLEK